MVQSHLSIPSYIVVFAVLSAPLYAHSCQELSKKLGEVFTSFLDGHTLTPDCNDETAAHLIGSQLVDGIGCFGYYNLRETSPITKSTTNIGGAKGTRRRGGTHATDGEVRARSLREGERRDKPDSSRVKGAKRPPPLKAEGADFAKLPKVARTPADSSNGVGTNAAASPPSKKPTKDDQRSSPPAKHSLTEIGQLVHQILVNIPRQSEKLQCARKASLFTCAYNDEDLVLCYFKTGEPLRNPNGKSQPPPIKATV